MNGIQEKISAEDENWVRAHPAARRVDEIIANARERAGDEPREKIVHTGDLEQVKEK